MSGACVLTSVGRACGLRPSRVKRSDRSCKAARRARPPQPPASQTQSGPDRMGWQVPRDAGGSGRTEEPGGVVWIQFLLGRLEKYINLGPHVPCSCLHRPHGPGVQVWERVPMSPHNAVEVMACHQSSPGHPIAPHLMGPKKPLLPRSGALHRCCGSGQVPVCLWLVGALSRSLL